MSTASSPPPEANPELRRPRRRQEPGGMPAFVWASIRMAWRWLTRMRTALYLLGLLALLTVVATFVPQEPNVPSTVAAWLAGDGGPGTGVSGVLLAVGAFDVYGSAAFLALTMLLFTSLTACLIPRIRAWIRLVRHSTPPLVRHLGGQDRVATFTTSLPPEQVHAAGQRLLRDRRWRVLTHAGSGPAQRDAMARPAQVAAEKGLWSREGGSLVFHLSFYVLLVAIVLGQFVTFEGQRGVVEGEPGFRDTAVSYWSYQPGRWFGQDDHAGWRLDLDAFEVDWVRDPLAPGAGQPTVFRSEVTITPADGGAPYTAIVDSNRPAEVDGMRVTQLDWGYAPRVVVEVDGEVVHDGFVSARLADGGAFRGAVKAPAADPDVGLEVFFYPYAPDGDNGPVPTGAPWADAPLLLFRQWRGDLQLGATQQTVTELDVSGLESQGGAYLRPGQNVVLDGVTVSFPEVRRWVGFQVSSRPQVPWLLLGAGLLVAGLVPALYAYRRRLWVLAVRDSGAGHTLVTVAGRAFQRPEAFEVEHAEIVTDLVAATAGIPAGSEGAGSRGGHAAADGGDPGSPEETTDDTTEQSTIRDRETDVLPAPARTGAAPQVTDLQVTDPR